MKHTLKIHWKEAMNLKINGSYANDFETAFLYIFPHHPQFSQFFEQEDVFMTNSDGITTLFKKKTEECP